MTRWNAILNTSQIDKLGNLAVFFSKNTKELSKTKLLKLVYLCEEFFVKKYAAPFLALPFEAWQFGPVQQELFVSLDSNIINCDGVASPLSKYISYQKEGDYDYIVAIRDFSDDDFSDDEIQIMTLIADTYRYHTAKELVNITHKENSLWYKTVVREPGLLEKFEKQQQSSSNITLDFSELLESDDAKEFYTAQVEMYQVSNSLKK